MKEKKIIIKIINMNNIDIIIINYLFFINYNIIKYYVLIYINND